MTKKNKKRMENKEIIQKIVKYLDKQPRESVNRLCANLMIDINRWHCFDDLEDDEKLNNNHVLLHERPDDIMKKISNNLLDKNDKRFNKIFNDSKDYKL
jgi:hypothetical protein